MPRLHQPDLGFDPPSPFRRGDWANFAVSTFDLETTGVEPKECRIVTWAFATVRADGTVTSAQGGVVRPDGYEIPEEAAAVHGWTNEKVAAFEGAEPMKVALTRIRGLMATARALGHPLVVFNAPFDMTVYASELERAGITPGDQPPILDPLVLDRRFERYRKGKRQLGVLCPAYGVELADAHDAAADAIAAARLLFAMAAKFDVLRHMTLDDLHLAQADWSAQQVTDFEGWLRRQKNEPELTLPRGWPVQE